MASDGATPRSARLTDLALECDTIRSHFVSWRVD
jgi:hypothetical protein